MDIKTYSETLIKTAPDFGFTNNMAHAALGIGGESGEVVDIIKKHWAYGKELDPDELKKELGDLLWYVNLAIKTAGLTWEDVLETNFKKLKTRYPDLEFSTDLAINRDTQAEAEAMKG